MRAYWHLPKLPSLPARGLSVLQTQEKRQRQDIHVMSGFEVAGIVLGTIPLLVSALETYSKLMRDWGKAPSELRSLNRQLSTERAKLYNVCDLLISDAVSHQDIESMLLNPFGPLWKVKETNDKIRRRLWDAYKPFEETVMEVDEALQSIMQRLRVQVSADGEVR